MSPLVAAFLGWLVAIFISPQAVLTIFRSAIGGAKRPTAVAPAA